MKTTFFLIRHGQTVWNTENRFQGQLNSPLTAQGIAQAQAVGKRLQDESISVVYTSDLGRSIETAQQIATIIGPIKVVPCAPFRERNYGVLEGLTTAEAYEQYAEPFQQDRSGTLDVTIPNGESRRKVLERVLAGLHYIMQTHSGERVVVVSHGGVLSTLLRYILNIPFNNDRRFHLRNGSLHQITFTNERWMVETLGEVHHLQDLLSEDSRA